MVESKMTGWDERRMCHVKGQAIYPPTQKLVPRSPVPKLTQVVLLKMLICELSVMVSRKIMGQHQNAKQQTASFIHKVLLPKKKKKGKVSSVISTKVYMHSVTSSLSHENQQDLVLR